MTAEETAIMLDQLNKKPAQQLLIVQDWHWNRAEGLNIDAVALGILHPNNRDTYFVDHEEEHWYAEERFFYYPIVESFEIGELRLSHNYLSTFSEQDCYQLSRIPHLKKLTLAYNKFETLPEYFALLSNVEEIDLSFNYLEEVPTILYKLKNLKKLTLTGNTGFPLWIDAKTKAKIRSSFPNCQVIF